MGQNRNTPWVFNKPTPDMYGEKTYYVTEEKDKGDCFASLFDNEPYYNTAPTEDNAKFIVEAVNNHAIYKQKADMFDELVEQVRELQAIVSCIENADSDGSYFMYKEDISEVYREISRILKPNS